MVTPNDLTLADAETLVTQAATRTAAAEALAYVQDGDMWQEGRAWVGPRPTGNEPGATLINEEIRRGLAAANLAGELVGRHVAGVLGREPQWELLTPATLPDDDAAALVAWWDRLGLPLPVGQRPQRMRLGNRSWTQPAATIRRNRSRSATSVASGIARPAVWPCSGSSRRTPVVPSGSTRAGCFAETSRPSLWSGPSGLPAHSTVRSCSRPPLRVCRCRWSPRSATRCSCSMNSRAMGRPPRGLCSRPKAASRP